MPEIRQEQKMTSNQLIIINAGSSSIKFAAFLAKEGLPKICSGVIENIGTAPLLKMKDGDGKIIKEQAFPTTTHYTDFYHILFLLLSENKPPIITVGHRVVHGGSFYQQSVAIDSLVIDNLKKLIPFAPLHQPYNIEAIEILARTHPDLLQVACFDTAFHSTHPAIADKFGLPRELTLEGVRRYGFHGLSYEYIVGYLKQHVPQKASGKIIVAHLGNGASLCAIKEGISIDSTMGFTALDGLLMGTRCGTLDPGVMLYLLKFKKMSYQEIEDCLYKKSGLLGVSGISNDMQALLNAADASAQEAIELFVYRLKYHLGALMAVLGGLDVLVFTGGIGENASIIRQAVCREFAWLGLTLDEASNAKHQPIISSPQSQIEVRVIPTNEEKVIAKHSYEIYRSV